VPQRGGDGLTRVARGRDDEEGAQTGRQREAERDEEPPSAAVDAVSRRVGLSSSSRAGSQHAAAASTHAHTPRAAV
jgi:hypothetical protein